MKKECRFLQNSKGNVAIELAIVLPLIFLLLSGIVNFGLILANKNQVNAVVSVGMLYAFGNSSNTAAIIAAMQNATNLTPLTVTATQFCECSNGTKPACSSTCTGGGAPGSYVTVTAQSQVNLFALDFIIANPFTTKVQGTIRTFK